MANRTSTNASLLTSNLEISVSIAARFSYSVANSRWMAPFFDGLQKCINRVGWKLRHRRKNEGKTHTSDFVCRPRNFSSSSLKIKREVRARQSSSRVEKNYGVERASNLGGTPESTRVAPDRFPATSATLNTKPSGVSPGLLSDVVSVRGTDLDGVKVLIQEDARGLRSQSVHDRVRHQTCSKRVFSSFPKVQHLRGESSNTHQTVPLAYCRSRAEQAATP